MRETTNEKNLSRFHIRTFIDDSKKIVIKSFDTLGKLERYYRILDFLYKKRFPVNKVIEIDRKNLILKLEYIEGISPYDIFENLSEDDIRNILDQLAYLIYNLHNTVKAKLAVPFSIYYKKKVYMILKSLEDKVSYRFFKQLVEEVKWDSYYLSLTHGDLNLKNIIVNDNLKIVGIIDWSCAEYNDPFYDIAIFEGLNPYIQKNLRDYFVKKYLKLAGENYRIYHQYKIIYQAVRVLESLGKKLTRNHVEKIIDMIEKYRNIDITKFIPHSKRG